MRVFSPSSSETSIPYICRCTVMYIPYLHTHDFGNIHMWYLKETEHEDKSGLHGNKVFSLKLDSHRI